MTFPFGETLTRSRPPTANREGDRDGDRDTKDYDGCAVWPTGSAENLDLRDQVDSEYTALVPDVGADILATDQVVWRGDTYDVAGRPERFRNPFNGDDPGLLVRMNRSTG